MNTNRQPSSRRRADDAAISANEEKPRNAVRPAASGGALSTTERIVEAAAHLFATRGYASGTLEEVAAHAGFTKGAVYYYFKDKESLLLAVLQRIEERSIVKTIGAIAKLAGSASAQLETFVKMQTLWAAQFPEDLAILMLTSAETAHTPPRVRSQMQRFYAAMSTALQKIIEEGKRSGEFSQARDTDDTVLYLQAVHDGNMMLWYRSGTDPAIGKRIARVTLQGFSRAVRD